MKIRVTVHAAAPMIVEIPDEDLEYLSDEEREGVIEDYADVAANDMIDVGYEEVED